MKKAVVLAAVCLLLSGCSAAAREPDELALVRVLGVDGAGQVTLTAVCGKAEGQEAERGASQGKSFEEARRQLPWSGGKELSLTSVTYLLVGEGVDLQEVLFAVLEDAELGASAVIWLAEDGAANLLEESRDPTPYLELLERRGAAAPTVAQALAALCTDGTVDLPVLSIQEGKPVWLGTKRWEA